MSGESVIPNYNVSRDFRVSTRGLKADFLHQKQVNLIIAKEFIDWVTLPRDSVSIAEC